MPLCEDPAQLSILVADDEPSVREMISSHLRRRGHRSRVATDGEDALQALRAESFDLLITDVQMPRIDGLHLLQQMRAEGIRAEAIVISAFPDIPKAVGAFRFAVCDLLEKPFELSRLDAAVDVAHARIRRSRAARETAAPTPLDSDVYVGRSAATHLVLDLIRRVGPTCASVLIEGETGVGKELVARALHDASPRAAKPFVAVNCGALPEGLVESQLFGHEKGAFTGAVRDSPGVFRTASGGTLFLDEVGDLPLSTQVKLLRAIQEREVVPVGATEPQSVNVRIIGATNRSLDLLVHEGRFRRDLLYRLKVVTISIPPLRSRLEDVETLSEHFVKKLNARYGQSVRGLDPSALEALLAYDFPGNARELENLLERAFALGATDWIRASDLPPLRCVFGAVADVAGWGPKKIARFSDPDDIPTIEEAKSILIDRALEAAGGNVAQAALILGIDRKTIMRRRKEPEA